MNTALAFIQGELHRDCDLMVFDWDKAAQIIRERQAQEASAGLSGDWECTGGQILEGGKPIDKEDIYTYLASTWATPELEIDGEIIPCFKLQKDTPGWNSSTFWPESARMVLGL